MLPEDIDNRFNYHPPKNADRVQAHEVVRDACHQVALLFNTLLPEGREKSTAVTKLEEAMFWGNAAVARQPDGETR